MKPGFFALLVIAFSSLALAATPIEKFVNSTFEPDQNVSGAFLLPGNSVYVIVADGVETYAYDAAAGAAISDPASLAALLSADSKAKSGFEQKVASAKAFDSQVRAAKNASEQLCMQLTGTQMHDCRDKDTCVLACMSNPNCANPLYSDGFWEAILDWTNTRKGFDASLSEFSAGLDAVSTDPAAIDSRLSALDELSASGKKLSQSILFLNRTDEGCSGANATKRCFEYCKKIDYSAQAIAAQRGSLVALKAALLDVQNQPARAQAILAAGAANAQYVSARGGEFASLRIRMAGGLSRLNSTSQELSAKVNDTQIQPMSDSLFALSAKIEKAGKEGRYRAALSDKQKYESSISEISDRLASDLKKYDTVLAQIEEVRSKANSSSWLIGAPSYEKYSLRLSTVRSSLTMAPVTLAEISDAGSEIESVRSDLSDEISAKAAQGGAAAPQQGAGKGLIPCLPAFALLAIAGFAAFRKQ